MSNSSCDTPLMLVTTCPMITITCIRQRFSGVRIRGTNQRLCHKPPIPGRNWHLRSKARMLVRFTNLGSREYSMRFEICDTSNNPFTFAGIFQRGRSRTCTYLVTYVQSSIQSENLGSAVIRRLWNFGIVVCFESRNCWLNSRSDGGSNSSRHAAERPRA
jgi:hypothetical protein